MINAGPAGEVEIVFAGVEHADILSIPVEAAGLVADPAVEFALGVRIVIPEEGRASDQTFRQVREIHFGDFVEADDFGSAIILANDHRAAAVTEQYSPIHFAVLVDQFDLLVNVARVHLLGRDQVVEIILFEDNDAMTGGGQFKAD